MAGPIIEAVRDRLGIEEDDQIINIEESPLTDHRQKVIEQMDSAGGCCGAAAAARTVRDEEMRFE